MNSKRKLVVYYAIFTALVVIVFEYILNDSIRLFITVPVLVIGIFLIEKVLTKKMENK
jgi:hypothetical protein